jgi:hypothetical protein
LPFQETSNQAWLAAVLLAYVDSLERGGRKADTQISTLLIQTLSGLAQHGTVAALLGTDLLSYDYPLAV